MKTIYIAVPYASNPKRGIEKMRKEAIQVAAMAVRFINDSYKWEGK